MKQKLSRAAKIAVRRRLPCLAAESQFDAARDRELAWAVAYYEEFGVTKAVAMAMSAIERGLDPWQPTDADRDSVSDLIKARAVWAKRRTKG
jgi:hypothetical protein